MIIKIVFFNRQKLKNQDELIQSFNNEKTKFINNVTDLTNKVERYRKEIENPTNKFNISEVKNKK